MAAARELSPRRFGACRRAETHRVKLAESPITHVNEQLFAKLRCPLTGQDLRLDGASLVTLDGSRRYALSSSGVPLFGEVWLSEEGGAQRAHYERIAGEYLDNLSYPHTREY